MLKNITSRIFGKVFSNETAKNRLQMVLIQDRSGLTSEEMDLFRRDLLDVICKYFVLERKQVDIEWQRTDACTALIINTPVMGRPRSQEKKKVQAAALAT